MDETQEKFERTVGNAFIAWYNRTTKSNFSYAGRPNEAPDLIYIDGTNKLLVEVGAAYSGAEEAAFWWKNLRKVPDAPRQGSGKDMDENLITDINKRIEEKCANAYGTNCFLLVYVHPAMTTADEVEECLDQIKIPEKNPFPAIFVSGHFPSSTRSAGGYRCWKLLGNEP